MRLPRQVQAGEPGLDAARPGGLARAIEPALAGAEEELGDFAVQGFRACYFCGAFCCTFCCVIGFGSRKDTVLQQQREQQPGLVQRRQCVGLAALPPLHQARRQATGGALHDVAHGGIQLGRQPTQGQRVGPQQHQLRHHGAFGQQVQGQHAQLPQRGQLSRQVGHLRRRHACQQIEQARQGSDGFAAELDAGHHHCGAVVHRQPQWACWQGCRVVRGIRFHGLHRVARDTAHLQQGQFPKVAATMEHGVGRQHAPQRLAQVGDHGEVQLRQRARVVACCAGASSAGRAWLGRCGIVAKQCLRHCRHCHFLGTFKLHALLFEPRWQVDAAQAEHQKRVGVDLLAQQVDHSRQVFARHRPIGARAVHLQVAPAGREDGNVQPLRQLQHLGVELAVEQPGNHARVIGQAVDQPAGQRVLNLRHANVNVVRAGARALHAGTDLRVRHHQVAHRTAVGVGATPRQAVVMVDLRQGLQPLRAPPGAAVLGVAHRVGGGNGEGDDNGSTKGGRGGIVLALASQLARPMPRAELQADAPARPSTAPAGASAGPGETNRGTHPSRQQRRVGSVCAANPCRYWWALTDSNCRPTD